MLTVLEKLSTDTEIIIVDDGSTDETASIVEQLISYNENLHLVILSRNFGHQNAVSAGLSTCRGSIIAIIDADLQDPPELIPEMLDRLNQGYDVVYGVRKNRKEPLINRACYRLYYRILTLLSERPLPRDAGDFSIMRRRVVDQLNELPERGRYVRGLRNWVGFRQSAFHYDRPARLSGTSKYKWKTLFKLASRGVLSSSRLPLTLAIYIGSLLAFAGFLWAVKVVVVRLLYDTAPEGFSALMVALLVVGGTQLIAIGIIGMYLARVLDQVEGRPNYIIARHVTSPETAKPGLEDAPT